MSRDALAQVLGGGDGAGVVDARCAVVSGHIVSSRLLEALLEAVPGRSTRRAVGDHLGNLSGGARGLDVAVVAGA